MRFNEVTMENGSFRYKSDTGILTVCSFDLFLIGQARDRGCDFENLADGFGPGLGTMGGDWSGIRDSTDEAVRLMLERALNYLFGRKEDTR